MAYHSPTGDWYFGWFRLRSQNFIKNVSSSSDTDSESSSDEENLEPYRSRARSIVREGGRVPQTADGGDLGGDEGWTRNFVSPNTDLNFNEDGKGPVNIPGSITEESEPTDFILVFGCTF